MRCRCPPSSSGPTASSPPESLIWLYMNDRNLVRGLFLIAISLVFGLVSLRYPMGQFSRAGPGLFPLLVSCLLFLIGLFTVVRSRFVERVPIDFNLRNISLILASLCGFAVISEQ